MSTYDSVDKPYDPNQKVGEPLTDFDRRVYASLAKAGQWLPKDFLSYMVEYLSINQPLVPIGQVVGFSQYTAQAAPQINTSQSTSSTTPTDLATAGPTLTGLPSGKYVVWFGAAADTSPVNSEAYMGVKANSTEPTTSDAAVTFSANRIMVSRAHTFTLTNSNNTLLARYWAASAGTGTWQNRWMLALRYANE